MPCDDLYMRSVVTQRPNYECSVYERLKFSVEKQIAHLLEKEVDYHRSMELLKYELKGMRDWSDVKGFNSVDSRRQGYLDYYNIMNFCRMNGYRASEPEIIAVVRRLDVDADQIVNFEEF